MITKIHLKYVFNILKKKIIFPRENCRSRDLTGSNGLAL